MPQQRLTHPAIVTTSWDDGDPHDLRVAELLTAYGICGTFYVPLVGYRGGPTLTRTQLRELADEGFEVGGHTVSHVTLRGLKGSELTREVSNCRLILQQITGTPIGMFCYPNGTFDSSVIDAVKRAGYCGARTTRMLQTSFDLDRFQMPTTLQAYPHSAATYARNAMKALNVTSLIRHSMRIASHRRWVDLGKRTFDFVLQHGGIWHLYGHSWELQELQLWNGLSELFEYVSKRLGVTYATNLETLNFALASSKRDLIPAACLPQANQSDVQL